MEENDDSLIFEVKLEENNLEERVKVLKQQIEALKQQKKNLDTLNKSGVVTGKAYADQLEEIEKRTKSAKTELQGHTRTLDLQQKAQKSAAGSITQLRANLSLLTAQYAELSAEERDATDAGAEMQKQLTEQIAKLKALEKAYGDSRRNVGNYTDGMREAARSHSPFISTLLDVKDTLTQTVEGLRASREGLREQIAGLKGTAAGFEGAKKSSIAFGLSLNALGIGLLITALAGLVSFFTKTEKGALMLKQVISGLSAAFDVFVRALAPIGELLTDLFTGNITSIKDFTTRLGGARKELSGVGSAMLSAAKAAAIYEKRIKELEKAQRAQMVASAEANREAEFALKRAEDTTLGIATRREALQRAFKIQSNAVKADIDLLRAKANVEREAIIGTLRVTEAERERLRKKSNADFSREIETLGVAEDQRQRFRDAAVQAIEKETELRLKSMDLVKEDNALRQEGADKSKEQAENQLATAVQIAQLRLERAQMLGEETLKLEEALILKQGQQEAFGLKKSSDLRKAIEAKTNAEILKLRLDYAVDMQQQELELKAAEVAASLTLARRGSKEELELIVQSLRIQGQQREVEARKQYRKDAEYEQARAAIVLQTQRQIDDARAAFARGEIERVAELGQLRIQTEIDLNKTSIDNDRILAERRIDLEEKTQLELLEIAEISEEERLVRMNAIQAKALAERREVYKQLREDERTQTQALLDIRLASVKKGTVEELKLKKEQLALQMKAELDNLKLTEEQKEAIKAKYREQEEEAVDAFNESVAANTIESAARATQVATTLIEASIARRTAVLDKQQKAALQSAGLNADLRAKVEETFQKRREKLEKDAAKKRQRIASIENVINTAKAVTVAITGAPPPFSAILAAIAGAQGLAQQVLIDSQQFARGGVYLSDGRGGYVRGPGTATSDSINSRLSNGESVNNAESTKMFYPLYSLLNQLGGGKAYPNTPAYNPSTFLAPAPAPSANPEQLAALVEQGVARALERMPNPVVTVDDINKGQKKVTAIRDSNDV
ncbi:hypothetical protein F5984_09745 [Rudanella paleaurantiibacter]|uniref:Uncharacterized protein n=1 Tax=Rudanella paleaurantiibacter TaxID=2614655 RepID=A0A7J5U0C2_9BACT|nr:hypothetical protein [Rudanella paleaurantiibacter]KAB7731087.1 hypothetical protein F5984_09745 [Rudanella paleaurantiibacter]